VDEGVSGRHESLGKYVKHHIQTVAAHYQGKVAGWDVVNESFLDDGTLRPSIWAEHIPDYIAKSFQWAHEADPKAILFTMIMAKMENQRKWRLF